MVAHNPLDRSGRAVLPDPALASGDNAKAAQRVRMMDARRGQPAVSNPQHPAPQHTAVLAAPRQRALPETDHLEPKQTERRAVHGNTVVAVVSLDHRAQPLSHFRNGVVHTPLELGFHLTQLGLQPLAYRLPQHREPSVAPLLPADVREAEEVEGLGLPLPAPLAVFGRIGTELQQAGLVRVQLQPELAQSFGEFLPEPLSIRPHLESEHDIVGEAYDDHVAAGLLLTPHSDPHSGAGEHRISRFSCEVFPYVYGVSDRAGLGRISRYRCVRCCLPLLLTASASRRNALSRLNTRPARSPVNASTLPLREAPHDSGPSWVAGPLTCDSFIHNTSPV